MSAPFLVGIGLTTCIYPAFVDGDSNEAKWAPGKAPSTFILEPGAEAGQRKI